MSQFDAEGYIYRHGVSCLTREELIKHAKNDLSLAHYMPEDPTKANLSFENNAQFLKRVLKINEHIAWLSHFQGTMPKHWDLGINITMDLQKLRDEDVKVSTPVLDMVVSHPDLDVVFKGARLQLFDIAQLALIIARRLLLENYNDIVLHQHNKGLGSELAEARKLAFHHGPDLINAFKDRNAPQIYLLPNFHIS